jgi:hypothetical protein
VEESSKSQDPRSRKAPISKPPKVALGSRVSVVISGILTDTVAAIFGAWDLDLLGAWIFSRRDFREKNRKGRLSPAL